MNDFDWNDFLGDALRTGGTLINKPTPKPAPVVTKDKPFNWTPVIWIGGALVALGVVWAILSGSRKSA